MSSPYNTFSYYTFGCKVNFADTCTISRQLIGEGFSEVKIDAEADIYIVNTCSVTENANKKARRFINKLHKRSPNSKIIVTGCYAQLNPEELSDIPGVSNVINAQNKFNIKSYINYDNRKNIISDINGVKNFISSYSINERTRAFLKIQDGCDYTCSYCTIPMARGKSRSANIEDTVLKVEEIVHKGINEIVLCGINVGDFGSNNNESLLDLLIELEQVEQLKRYRISSIEPNLLNNEMIEFVSKSKKFVPHFHVPLQSGSDKILKKMKRRYLTNLFSNRVKIIKHYMPNSCIGVDVIVGFPGECDKEFMKTYDYISKLDISYLHVFKYSERSNTEAINYSKVVPELVRKKRSKMLRELSFRKKRYFYESQIGKKLNILFESENKNGFIEGFTENYIKVREHWNPEKTNTIHKRLLRSIDEMGYCRV